ncbi:solanesyl diphosphate synthase 3, chloroplastic/mitochondrial-like isoform X2 [Durio zibethinus]|uniref:Solanesyl diphosphate synthase 3, chloroplastic/mitochondrial-like isoform X2 n=1 Tax=Durio zibethinus TaxID=66656 RepID=A0A6P5X8Y1_DURZI|nr:solanesyl diphosphate synthase 3, chloroplastic/mitochondrial-like isoform X2 [Durio zibethinus]
MTVLFSRVITRISGTPRKTLFGCPQHCQSLVFSTSCLSSTDSNPKGDALLQEKVDPFSLVADEISLVSKRLRSSAVAKVPELASAAGYLFKEGVEGKRTCSTVLLLMATAMDIHRSESPLNCIGNTLRIIELRRRQQLIAEITEMIHVASLIHDDVLDDADTRRGIGSLNSVVGNKLAVLAGDFLLFRALGALASLKNTVVVSLLVTAVENLVTGETMQMAATIEQHCSSMEYYMQKTYYKTASLISNSCKAIALLSDQTPGVAMLAFEYGKNLGLAYQFIDDILDFTGTSASLGKGSLSDIRQGIITAPILFAMEEFPQLQAVIEQGFNNPANVDTALEYLWKSHGIQRTRELATKHANLAAAAIDSLPESSSMDVCGGKKSLSWSLPSLLGLGRQIHQSSYLVEEQLDPFSLVGNRLRSMVVAEVLKLASAAEYFFKMEVEGKRFRPTEIP